MFYVGTENVRGELPAKKASVPEILTDGHRPGDPQVTSSWKESSFGLRGIWRLLELSPCLRSGTAVGQQPEIYLFLQIPELI